MAVTLVCVSKATSTTKTRGSVMAYRNTELVSVGMIDLLTVSTKNHKQERGKSWQKKNNQIFSPSLRLQPSLSYSYPMLKYPRSVTFQFTLFTRPPKVVHVFK